MELPQDNYLLLSIINMKLRDECLSFEDFCAQYDVSSQDICRRMEEIGYFYDQENSAFKRG